MNSSCQKCGGLLVIERVLEYYGPMAGMKCVNCGWYRRNLQPWFKPAGGSNSRKTHR